MCIKLLLYLHSGWSPNNIFDITVFAGDLELCIGSSLPLLRNESAQNCKGGCPTTSDVVKHLTTLMVVRIHRAVCTRGRERCPGATAQSHGSVDDIVRLSVSRLRERAYSMYTRDDADDRYDSPRNDKAGRVSPRVNPTSN